MGKNCVQDVRIALYNQVDTRPQFPHPHAINSYQQPVTHIYTHRNTILSTRLTLRKFTAQLRKITEINRQLSTVSTVPTTTTTTYI